MAVRRTPLVLTAAVRAERERLSAIEQALNNVTGGGVGAYDPAGSAAAAEAAANAYTDAEIGALATVATTGAYADLSGLPTLGTAAAQNVGAFATAAQGALADSATQPGDNVSTLTNDAGYATGGGTASGTNTGDQTSIVGITGTLAEFNAALTGADFATGGGTATGTNTGDQTSVTGNAGTATALQTARNIDGQPFNGTADITVIAPGTNAAASKATPVDADSIPLVDSAASNALKKLTWANLKATLKAYTDTLYQPLLSLAANTFYARSSAGAAANKTISDDALAFVAAANNAAMRSALGLGTAATQNTGTSGANVPLLNANNVQSGTMEFSSTFRRTGVISPPQITANQNNYNPTGVASCNVMRLDLDAARTITGLASGAGTANWQEITIVNISAFTLTLQHDNGVTSTATNRFLCPGSANVTVSANGAVRIIYDAVSQRWRVISR